MKSYSEQYANYIQLIYIDIFILWTIGVSHRWESQIKVGIRNAASGKPKYEIIGGGRLVALPTRRIFILLSERLITVQC
jgi:hypothetical protein